MFLGGGLGAMLRALLGLWLVGADTTLPISILVINLLGAFAIGVVYGLADEAGVMRSATRLFLAVGLLGGFTTFSSFGWGAFDLLHGDHWLPTAVYVLVSLFGGCGATLLGMAAAREGAGALERAALELLTRLNGHGRRRHPHITVDLVRNDPRTHD